MAEPDDRIVLIEAGISQRGEMARLERMIRPDLGIVTNIGDAHQENFDSPRQKADEKLTLFEHTPTIVYNAADPLLARLVPERYDDRKLIGVEPAERELDGLPFDDPPRARTPRSRSRCTARWASTRSRSGSGCPGCKASPCGSSSRTA